ncbi:response regulator [Flavobacterium sp.]|uniref:response regulator n=1 Tax=Flavobacterium sp. TaxID=239 RepID=UPI003266A8AD
MNTKEYNLLLADDDEDDCDFFREALNELPITYSLITVNDGVELMSFLSDKSENSLPDILFLDLNMPRKNGFECLTEIKQNKKLQPLSVIIFSTSLDVNIVDTMYENGAIYYIRKPGDYSKLKKVIGNALALISGKKMKQPEREQFILQP